MQKSFCDLCGNELVPGKLNGGIMRNSETFPLFPVAGSTPGQVVQKRIIQEVWDLCEDCQRFIWKTAEEKKADLGRTKQILEKS